MQDVNVGIVGLGNVGSSTLAILSENGDQIALKLGYRLKVVAVCSRSVHTKQIPAGLGDVFKTTDWREVVAHPDVQIVAENQMRKKFGFIGTPILLETTEQETGEVGGQS